MCSRPAEYKLTVPLSSDVLVWTVFSGVVHHTFGHVSSKDDFIWFFLSLCPRLLVSRIPFLLALIVSVL